MIVHLHKYFMCGISNTYNVKHPLQAFLMYKTLSGCLALSWFHLYYKWNNEYGDESKLGISITSFVCLFHIPYIVRFCPS